MSSANDFALCELHVFSTLRINTMTSFASWLLRKSFPEYFVRRHSTHNEMVEWQLLASILAMTERVLAGLLMPRLAARNSAVGPVILLLEADLKTAKMRSRATELLDRVAVWFGHCAPTDALVLGRLPPTRSNQPVKSESLSLSFYSRMSKLMEVKDTQRAYVEATSSGAMERVSIWKEEVAQYREDPAVPVTQHSSNSLRG